MAAPHNLQRETSTSAMCAGKQPVANEVLDSLERLTLLAEEMAAHVEAKLSPIMAEDYPRACEPTPDKEAPFPPYFGAQRLHITRIREALRQIAHLLERTEI